MPQLSYTEENVIQAMLDVTDNGLSQNQAAQKNGVPQTTLSDRLRGLPSRSEITQPAQLLSKSQESRLVTWILRQEALGYAPSHSQVRATVAALLRQQGRERHIGVHWLARFIKRHPDIETKVGKRQEAARFNSFTPMAVNWYFGIRESEYGWIKRENTVNVDEGGIMAGFGLDSLVIGSSDPRRKAFLKGSQSRTWTTFIEAVTADGRLLKPGIIFKGKELQQQWFIDEFRKIADWYYITSDNGWMDNHIAVEWLKEVYLPQTQPADESDARLIILDGHGSHVSDEWMATCFLNNPLDNGVFNTSKAAYRKELQKLTSLTDSAPVDKVNFIKAYAKARAVGMTKKNILSGWRVTGNWPISRRKTLMHPEIQPDKKETTPGSDPRRKAFLKGSQSRTWTTFIEAVTADGRLLKPGIIFKGKELQQQWFIDEFRKIADWYYITSDNGWMDNHIAVEWLKEVYLPQTQPADESDARLIILDGHGSHVSDEWMATCFLNNPLDNGVFNTSKAAYRKELQKLTSLTDSAPVDKVNFIKAYAKARAVGMTKKNILSGWRVTGNWPISRRKTLMHPEIQPDKKETTPGSDGHRDGQVDSDHTPKTSRHIRDMGKNKSPSTRRRYSVISKGFEAQESKIASLSTRIASLEEEVGRLSRGKKRKAIPNPNKRFMTLAEALVTGEAISEVNEAIEEADAVEDVIEVGGIEEDQSSNSEEEELTVVRTRAGREVRIPRKY
ncbi:hypothetical protein FOMG_18654 [Fusarium oxysporum f. sp. melonis 26406]|uniref:HTH CENPB-type domain-containing protein n=2 Tax=Fusarium oxysporum TaxID=5507 RepID=W9ZU68_FUSOX|nr:hypothetical protein FOMG_18654 [Fusarium oxysporum f. sp. melonis 26406]